MGGTCLLEALPQTLRVIPVSDRALDRGLDVGDVAFVAAHPPGHDSPCAFLSAPGQTGVLLSVTPIQDQVGSETIEGLGHSAKFAT